MESGSLIAYWGAIAQVVPVLALALVLEGRSVARRFRRKRWYRQRSRRVGIGLLYLVVAVGLTLSEAAALGFLAFDLRNYESAGLVLTGVSILVALLAVILLPLAPVISGATADAWNGVRMLAPWSEAKRMLRTVDRAAELTARQRRATADYAGALLAAEADYLVEIGPALRKSDQLLRKAEQLASTLPDSNHRKQHVADLIAEQAREAATSRGAAETLAKVTELRGAQAELAEKEVAYRLLQAEIRDWIARGGSPHELKQFRRRLADAGRA